MTTSIVGQEEFVRAVETLEQALMELPESRVGDDACKIFHHFADGLYIREMHGPKGLVVVTKLHKTTHPYFVTKGDVSVQTQDTIVRIKAPYFGITKAGTKRIAYFHEDTIWITVHATEEKDLSKIEDEVIAKNWDELPEHIKKSLIGGV